MVICIAYFVHEYMYIKALMNERYELIGGNQASFTFKHKSQTSLGNTTYAAISSATELHNFKIYH